MHKFKVGDRVKYLGCGSGDEYYGEWSGELVQGRCGEVVDLEDDDGVVVVLDSIWYEQVVSYTNIELVED